MSDRSPVGLLTCAFPPHLVGREVAACAHPGQRTWLLPPRVVVYLVLGMRLFSGPGYEEVMRLLTQRLTWAGHW
ncbi:transposase domain-containing protein [Streptomyces sp. JJ66]|nr:transposase domain-containing protein [Streptomyces sp. JJ66]